jgi:hypothetical protein
VVLADGYIHCPAEPMPYRVLRRILTDGEDVSRFNPPYGQVLAVPVANSRVVVTPGCVERRRG